MRIGFVGLGTMGGPMARRLAAQGHQVTGYDVDAARVAQARDGGVTPAAPRPAPRSMPTRCCRACRIPPRSGAPTWAPTACSVP